MRIEQKGATRQGQPQRSLQQHIDKDTHLTDKSASKLLYELMIAENQERYPNNPYPLSPKRYNLRNTADLTRATIKMIQLHGFQANHITPKIRFIDKSFTTTDVLGHRLKIGSGYWIGGALTNGSPIISTTINGQSIKLEIRNCSSSYGQCEAQKQYRYQIEQASGLYIVVTSFGDFATWFYSFIENSHD